MRFGVIGIEGHGLLEKSQRTFKAPHPQERQSAPPIGSRAIGPERDGVVEIANRSAEVLELAQRGAAPDQGVGAQVLERTQYRAGARQGRDSESLEQRARDEAYGGGSPKFDMPFHVAVDALHWRDPLSRSRVAVISNQEI